MTDDRRWMTENRCQRKEVFECGIGNGECSKETQGGELKALSKKAQSLNYDLNDPNHPNRQRGVKDRWRTALGNVLGV